MRLTCFFFCVYVIWLLPTTHLSFVLHFLYLPTTDYLDILTYRRPFYFSKALFYSDLESSQNGKHRRQTSMVHCQEDSLQYIRMHRHRWGIPTPRFKTWDRRPNRSHLFRLHPRLKHCIRVLSNRQRSNPQSSMMQPFQPFFL